MKQLMLRRSAGCVAMLVVLAACGTARGAPLPKPTIPPGADAQVTLQVEIAQQLSGQGLTFTDIHCPADVSPMEGSATTCTGVAAGQTVSLPVTFVADNQIIVSIAP